MVRISQIVLRRRVAVYVSDLDGDKIRARFSTQVIKIADFGEKLLPRIRRHREYVLRGNESPTGVVGKLGGDLEDQLPDLN